eukprot:02713.XXX_51184_51390_1 [CDS] Oithona nana genome sequencing.
MPLQIRADGKAPFAKIAFVGLFTGMRTQMTGQVGGSRKGFPAIFATVAFQFSIIVLILSSRLLSTGMG